MRQWKELDQKVTVSPQIRAEDVAHLASAGFKAIVCNRPDGEEAGQPDWDEIAMACRHNGITPYYIPMGDRNPTAYAVGAFSDALAATGGKVFAFCRSGARSESLWAAVKSRQSAGV